MTRRLLAAALAFLLAAASAAPAQDAREGTAAPAAPKAHEFLRLRALDYASYIAAVQKGASGAEPGPLADRPVKVLFADAAGKTATIDVRTDQDGRLDIPLAGVPKDASLQFIVPDEQAGDRWPVLAAPARTAGAAGPGEIAFVAVHDGEDPVACSMLNYVVTVPDRDEGHASLRVNLIAAVRNDSTGLWLGPRSAPPQERATLRFPIPAGMQVVAVRAGDHDLPIEVVPAGAGQEVLLREPLWPAGLAEDTMVRIVVTGAFQEGGDFDFSFTPAFPLDSVGLNLEEGVLWYVPGDGVALKDAGPNPPMADKKPTHGWRIDHVHAGQRLGLRVSAKTPPAPPIDRRVWYTMGTLLLGVTGAALLAKALARGADAPRSPGDEAVASESDRAAMLAVLERRRARADVTRFEYAARKAHIQNPRGVPVAVQTAPTRARTAAPEAAQAAVEPDPRKLVDEIAARADTADADTLRRDVRSLLALLRGRGR